MPKAYTLTEQQANEASALIYPAAEAVLKDLKSAPETCRLYIDLMSNLGARDIVLEICEESGIDYSDYLPELKKEEESEGDPNEGQEPRTLRRGLNAEGQTVYF